MLGLRCFVQAFSSCSERGLLLVAVRGLLTVMASLVVGAPVALLVKNLPAMQETWVQPLD